MMNRSKEDWISQRAYSLWELDGRRDGRDFEHWAQASSEFERLERTKASPDGSELLCKLSASTSRLLRPSNSDNPQASAKEARRVV
jgi:hypothetical protein